MQGKFLCIIPLQLQPSTSLLNPSAPSNNPSAPFNYPSLLSIIHRSLPLSTAHVHRFSICLSSSIFHLLILIHLPQSWIYLPSFIFHVLFIIHLRLLIHSPNSLSICLPRAINPSSIHRPYCYPSTFIIHLLPVNCNLFSLHHYTSYLSQSVSICLYKIIHQPLFIGPCIFIFSAYPFSLHIIYLLSYLFSMGPSRTAGPGIQSS